ncbi:hypothetical protein GALMADRAFT_137484 [Galerina marginata CBS 339.88]|uniref:Uncharacterized protein n=1 Tax=Galerina marginata (strain CBS 339.88) TaxID=685588 RepID=A0A067T915_GALM3|nr:hypothetical protein GALMADRAFT_137484 [Galerina marginata CBS 339.88]
MAGSDWPKPVFSRHGTARSTQFYLGTRRPCIESAATSLFPCYAQMVPFATPPNSRQLPFEQEKILEKRAKEETAAHKVRFPDYRFPPVRNKTKLPPRQRLGLPQREVKEGWPTTAEEEQRCDDICPHSRGQNSDFDRLVSLHEVVHSPKPVGTLTANATEASFSELAGGAGSFLRLHC